MLALLLRPQIVIGIAACLAVGVLVSWAGYSAGKAVGFRQGDEAGYFRAQQENAQADQQQMQERSRIDAQVRNMDAARKCGLIGGVYRNGACE